MLNNRFVPNIGLTNGDGRTRPFHEFLADFNILAIRRVPEPSHGPATALLRRLLAENRGVEDETVRGFDIRSPDRPCERCHEPHIVFQGNDLTTICDCDGSIYRLLDVVGYDRLFVIGADRRVIEIGSVAPPGCSSERSAADAALPRHLIARAPPKSRRSDAHSMFFNRKM